MDTIRINGKMVELDKQGFLVKPDDWSLDVAAYLAAVEGITMTEHHWAVVNILRDYYLRHQSAPQAKDVVDEIGRALGPDKGNAKYLNQLYPCGPAHQACKIAGLPG